MGEESRSSHNGCGSFFWLRLTRSGDEQTGKQHLGQKAILSRAAQRVTRNPKQCFAD